MDVKISMEASTDIATTTDNSYNFEIELNSDGSVSESFETSVIKLTRDIENEIAREKIKSSLLDIATSIKAGNISFKLNKISINQIEFHISVSSEDLLPTSKEFDAYVNVTVKNLITFRDSKAREIAISKEGVMIGVAVLGVVAICVFAPASIPAIPEWLSVLGVVSGV